MALQISRTRRPALLAATAMIAFGLIGGTPARALDDGQENIFDSLLGLVKMGIGFENDEEKPAIDYRERAPLVLPPKMELRQPMQPVGQRNAAWPVDQDLARQRQAAAAAARPRGNNVDADPLPARDLQRYGRIAPTPRGKETAGCTADGDRLCNPYEYWTKTAAIRGPADTSKDLVAGAEPKRAHLTDPPTGYRRATKNVKATFDPVDRSYSDNLGNQAAQIRDEARRRAQQ